PATVDAAPVSRLALAETRTETAQKMAVARPPTIAIMLGSLPERDGAPAGSGVLARGAAFCYHRRPASGPFRPRARSVRHREVPTWPPSPEVGPAPGRRPPSSASVLPDAARRSTSRGAPPPRL